MTDYPGGNKTANHCTYQEMVDRYWWEIRRALRLEWDNDVVTSHRKNLDAFCRDYRDMEPSETVADYNRRKNRQHANN